MTNGQNEDYFYQAMKGRTPQVGPTVPIGPAPLGVAPPPVTEPPAGTPPETELQATERTLTELQAKAEAAPTEEAAQAAHSRYQQYYQRVYLPIYGRAVAEREAERTEYQQQKEQQIGQQLEWGRQGGLTGGELSGVEANLRYLYFRLESGTLTPEQFSESFEAYYVQWEPTMIQRSAARGMRLEPQFTDKGIAWDAYISGTATRYPGDMATQISNLGKLTQYRERAIAELTELPLLSSRATGVNLQGLFFGPARQPPEAQIFEKEMELASAAVNRYIEHGGTLWYQIEQIPVIGRSSLTGVVRGFEEPFGWRWGTHLGYRPNPIELVPQEVIPFGWPEGMPPPVAGEPQPSMSFTGELASGYIIGAGAGLAFKTVFNAATAGAEAIGEASAQLASRVSPEVATQWAFLSKDAARIGAQAGAFFSSRGMQALMWSPAVGFEAGKVSVMVMEGASVHQIIQDVGRDVMNMYAFVRGINVASTQDKPTWDATRVSEGKIAKDVRNIEQVIQEGNVYYRGLRLQKVVPGGEEGWFPTELVKTQRPSAVISRTERIPQAGSLDAYEEYLMTGRFGKVSGMGAQEFEQNVLLVKYQQRLIDRISSRLDLRQSELQQIHKQMISKYGLETTAQIEAVRLSKMFDIPPPKGVMFAGEFRPGIGGYYNYLDDTINIKPGFGPKITTEIVWHETAHRAQFFNTSMKNFMEMAETGEVEPFAYGYMDLYASRIPQIHFIKSKSAQADIQFDIQPGRTTWIEISRQQRFMAPPETIEIVKQVQSLQPFLFPYESTPAKLLQRGTYYVIPSSVKPAAEMVKVPTVAVQFYAAGAKEFKSIITKFPVTEESVLAKAVRGIGRVGSRDVIRGAYFEAGPVTQRIDIFGGLSSTQQLERLSPSLKQFLKVTEYVGAPTRDIFVVGEPRIVLPVNVFGQHPFERVGESISQRQRTTLETDLYVKQAERLKLKELSRMDSMTETGAGVGVLSEVGLGVKTSAMVEQSLAQSQRVQQTQMLRLEQMARLQYHQIQTSGFYLPVFDEMRLLSLNKITSPELGLRHFERRWPLGRIEDLMKTTMNVPRVTIPRPERKLKEPKFREPKIPDFVGMFMEPRRGRRI